MYWIALLLVGLNLGSTSAAGSGESSGSGEASGSQQDPIASLNMLIDQDKTDYRVHVLLAEKQLRREPRSQILQAFVAFDSVASHMRNSDFDCSQDNVEDTLKSFARMREVLSLTYQDDMLNSSGEKALPIVQSISEMERVFLERCLHENFRQLSQPEYEKPLKGLKPFSEVGEILPENGPYSDQARKMAEGKYLSLPVPRKTEYDAKGRPLPFRINLDESRLELCKSTCGKMDVALKNLLETGLELLEFARSIGLRIGMIEKQIYFNYLICNAVKDNISKNLKG